MGFSYYVYIGAYLEIEAKPIESEGAPYCPIHGMFAHSTYCPECGTKTVTSVTTRPAMLWDLTDSEDLAQINGEGHPVEAILACGNLSKPLPDHLKDTDDAFAVQIKPDMIQEYMDNFMDNYRDIIRELRTKAEVWVRFGAVGYYY